MPASIAQHHRLTLRSVAGGLQAGEVEIAARGMEAAVGDNEPTVVRLGDTHQVGLGPRRLLSPADEVIGLSAAALPLPRNMTIPAPMNHTI